MNMLARFGLACLAGGALAAAAVAGGSPAPGALVGGKGVLAPGGALRYVAQPARGVTKVSVLRAPNARVVRSAAIRGTYGVPLVAIDGSTAGVSADGKTLVLAPLALQATSRFAVVSTKTLDLRRVVTLRGSFAFDAISPDARTVYLIQFVAAGNRSSYNVRALDLPSGRLVPGAIVDKRERESDMQGLPVTRATTRDGEWAFTLYANPAGESFVHALDTRRRAAVCVDLPWSEPAAVTAVRMALTADEHQLVLRQPGHGRLAVIDLRTFRVQAFRQPVAPGAPSP